MSRTASPTFTAFPTLLNSPGQKQFRAPSSTRPRKAQPAPDFDDLDFEEPEVHPIVKIIVDDVRFLSAIPHWLDFHRIILQFDAEVSTSSFGLTELEVCPSPALIPPCPYTELHGKGRPGAGAGSSIARTTLIRLDRRKKTRQRVYHFPFRTNYD